MAELARIRVHSLGVDHMRNFSVFLSNFAMALWYTRHPGVVVAVDLQIERAFGHPGLTTGIGYCVTLPVFGSSLPRNICEVGVPGVALAIEHHVVRLDQRIRQVVFGDDDARGICLEPRLGLQRKSPGLLLAQVYRSRAIPRSSCRCRRARRCASRCRRAACGLSGVLPG